MTIGMLWYFDSKKLSLEIAVKQAADYYTKKYGANPNRCFANVLAITEETDLIGIRLDSLKGILPNHLWIGVEKINESKS